MKKCPNCGTTENDEAKFCLNCGHELIADNKIESGQSATNVTQNIAVKKKSKGIIAVIIILITIIIILGILVFFLVSNSSSKKEDDNFKISE
ncbi:zinc-ribbon domain-containing protein, partial [Porcipelethomonas sp.]|uniref:zinc-ribbon domain-containing protein n=1 Tax=Porcipelethomonas sp. TaxID=2981675 RepID=UPI003EF553F8